MDNQEPQSPHQTHAETRQDKTRPAEHSTTIESVERRVVQFAELTIDAAKRLNPEVDISHNQLRELFSLTREFFGASQEVTDYLMKEAQTLSAELAGVEGFIGTFGLGYPFYALTGAGVPVEVAEISHFIELTQQLVNEDARKNPEGWNCAACQLVNKLPDLKTKCRPCDMVVLKPRDVFRCLPDLDMVIVVDNPTEETEQAIEAIANKLGYLQSDTDIAGAIKRTESILQDIKDGKEPAQKLPMDIHIWSKQAFEECMRLVAVGSSNVVIIGRSLHMQWEDNPINFWFDFVFSMTEIDMRDTQFLEAVKSARKQLKNNVGVEKVVKSVETTSPRLARLLQTEAIRAILTDKLESW